MPRWAKRYGDATPRHVGYTPPAAFSDNLQGCSAYDAGSHWHYVTYGLSELYGKHPDADPDVSGWGFELTMRVPRGSEQEAPGWPFAMLNELAKHVNGQAAPVAEGHRVDMLRAVTGHPDVPGAPDTALEVYAVALDPELGRIDTPNGSLAFLQVVGVTPEEKERMVASSTAAVLEELRLQDPLLMTDPGRA